MKPEIRPAKAIDTEAVLRINRMAFGDDKGIEVADLVAGLLVDPSAEPTLSLLAMADGQAIGHVLFTHVELPDAESPTLATLLAPLAVIPEFQSRGIGAALIADGLSRLKDSGIHLVFVLGHPGYYPRCGFQRACPLGFHALYQEPGTPNDAWMVHELVPGALGSASGGIKCAVVLDQLRHWRE